MSKNVKMCAITTISKTMDWFMVDSMRNLSNNGYDITLVSNMDDAFVQRNEDYAKCVNIPMNRGVSPKDLFVVPWKLYKLFRREKYDIIYYTTPNAALYASIAGLFAGVKCRYYNQWGIRFVSLSGIKRMVFKLIEKLTCMFSTTIRSASPLNMQLAINEGLCNKNKISVIGIGGTIGVSLSECDEVNVEEAKSNLRTKYGIKEGAFVYGYVGRINADKGINELIIAFSRLQRKYADIYLTLVGMIDDANPIDEENMTLAKNNDHIIFTGNIPSNEVYSYMAMFDTLVHPTYREGFGKVLQEAMGVRLPIITTNIPGPSEVVESGVSGILVNPKDSKSLYEKMELLYSDEDLRKSLSVEGRKRAETYFDRPIMLKNILDDINATLGM